MTICPLRFSFLSPPPTPSVSSAKAEEEPRIQERRDGIAVAEPLYVFLPSAPPCPPVVPCCSWTEKKFTRKRNKASPQTQQNPKPWLLVADLKALAEKGGRKLGCRTTSSGRESSLGTGRSLLPSPQIPLSTGETKGEARDVLGPLCSSHTRGINALPPGAPHTHSTCSVVGLIFTSTL